MIVCLLALFLACFFASVLSRQLGFLGFLDQPNERSSHQRATPRGGGLSFIIATLVVLPFVGGSVSTFGFPIVLIPLPLAVVGLVDDRVGLPAGLRFAAQLTTGFCLAVAMGLSVSVAPFAAVFVAAMINAVNFMDGLDGLVGSCLMLWLALAGVLLQQPLLLVLSAAVAGFLIWNWSPARLFMGDVGSTYLGAVMASGLLLAATQPSFQVSLGLWLAALPLLADAGLCLWRRLLAGQKLWHAHRLHLYQRLHQAGWNHGSVALLYAGATSVAVVVALFIQGKSLLYVVCLPALSVCLMVVCAIRLERYVAVPFDGRQLR